MLNDFELPYFAWLTSEVYRDDYDQLLTLLYEIDFESNFGLDENRAVDGLWLRREYGDDTGDYEMRDSLDDKECSVLEMMIALCHRIQDDMDGYPDIDNSVGAWFWDMVSSLGLIDSTDGRGFDEKKVRAILWAFRNRDYEPNGRGSLFTYPTDEDLRDVEIWYQMQGYRNYILGM